METTLMSLLRNQAHRVPQRPVALWGKEVPTYLEAYSLACVLARYFSGIADLSSGDAVLLSSPNSMGQFCALSAIQACGAQAVLAPTGVPREVLAEVLAGYRLRAALVADPQTCACVREQAPDVPVFSMGAPDVDAPSMGYMADQAIGLVDEVYLKIEDFALEEERDAPVTFIDARGRREEASASDLASEGTRLVADKCLADGARVVIAHPFSTREGVVRLHAAFSIGATIVLDGRGGRSTKKQQPGELLPENPELA